jgi:hypothetical protein
MEFKQVIGLRKSNRYCQPYRRVLTIPDRLI